MIEGLLLTDRGGYIDVEISSRRGQSAHFNRCENMPYVFETGLRRCLGPWAELRVDGIVQ